MVTFFYGLAYWSTISFVGAWVILYFLRLKKTQQNINTTTLAVAYDTTRYGSILTWSSRCLIINGQSTLIVSGEFHYWRIPDRSRWEVILRHYKGVGMNCVRLPLNWGYHSPNQGVYHFEDNRDVTYLLELCSKLNLYVIALPGPYIACDTQAGGLPLWLVAKKDIRLRHLYHSLWKVWDPNYYSFSKEWYQHILPILEPHQITTSKIGCIIALQLENKLVERILGFPLGLADELKSLAVTARELNITVPLLSSDLSDEGSFTELKTPQSSTSSQNSLWGGLKLPRFGLDLYGLTKNVIPPPLLKPGGGLQASSIDDAISWELWDPSEVFKNIDHIEERSKICGSVALQTPLIINELQAGWSNPPTSATTYDDLYTFYGSGLTRLLLESVLAQGCSVVSLYTLYGGTNWGSTGSPETYTSYDYAACIREYGHLSGEYRKLRASMLFIKSFGEFLLDSDRDYVPFITVSEPDIISATRLVTRFQERHGMVTYKANQAVELVFFRNLNDKESSIFDVQLNLTDELQQLDGHEPFFMSCQLPYKQSFIGLGNYSTINGLHLKFATKPIYARHRFRRNQRDCELWVVSATESLFSGELAFEGTVDSSGTLGVDFRVEDEGRVTLMSFDEGPGWVGLSHGPNTGVLYVVALDGPSLDSLYGAFREVPFGSNKGDPGNGTPFLLGWGAYDMEFDSSNDQLHVRHLAQDQKLTLLLPEYEDSAPPAGFQSSTVFNDLPFAYERTLDFPKELVPSGLRAQLVDCETRTSYFKDWDWVPLEFRDGRPTLSPLDLGSSALCAYRCCFHTSLADPESPPRVLLRLTARHRFTVFLNGTVIANELTMNQSRFRPGSVSGPDLAFLESPITVDLSDHLIYPSRLEGSGAINNELVILVESFGMGQMGFVFDDARNPRGLISASFQGFEKNGILSGSPVWQMYATDSRTLSNTYATHGLYEENLIDSSPGQNGWTSCSLDQLARPGPDMVWYRARFRHPLADQKLVVRLEDEVDISLECPLHVTVTGSIVASLWINGVPIGQYYGDQTTSQSQFYLMDGLLYEDLDQDNILSLAVFPVVGANHTQHPVSIHVGGYCVDLDVVGFSGNRAPANQGGRDFLLARQTLPLPSQLVCPASELFTPLAPSHSNAPAPPSAKSQ